MMNKQLSNIDDYKHHEVWLKEFNEKVGNIMVKSEMFSSLLPVETMMIDRRLLNLEWLDNLKSHWRNSHELFVVREFQRLFKSKYVGNVKPQIV